MGLFAPGEVVVAELPFTDLSGSKPRPVLVLAAPDDVQDLIVCLITSRARHDGYDIPLTEEDFVSGKLRLTSYARPCHLFSLDPGIITGAVGKLSRIKIQQAIDLAVQIIQGK